MRLRYRQAKETKRVGMDRGKSELLIVPTKQGNAFQRTLGREGGAGKRIRWRERWQELRVLRTSQRNSSG